MREEVLIILKIITIMVSCMMSTQANIGLQMTCYNSNYDMSTSLEGSNLNFGSYCVLMPQSIKYVNGGSSNQPNAEYSYSLGLNGDTTYTSAKTDSGMFSWQGSIRAGVYSYENLLKVMAKSGVKNGQLDVAYGNDEFKVQETVEAENSVYEQKTELGLDSVLSSGFGSTLTPVPGLEENLLSRSIGESSNAVAQTEDDWTTGGNDESESPAASKGGQYQGIRYSLRVQDVRAGKHGYLDSNVMGLTEAQLATQTKFEEDGYLFGVKTIGIGFAPIDELSMGGQATGLPIQTLPPGEVVINYNSSSDTVEPKPWEEYVELVEEESEKFDSEYSGSSTPALWYYLNNEFKNEVPVYINYSSNNPLDPVEYYDLGMVYKVITR